MGFEARQRPYPGINMGVRFLSELPQRLRTIGRNAFYACIAMKNILIYGNVETIGGSAFAACKGLTIHTGKGTAADAYAQSNGISCLYDAGMIVLDHKRVKLYHSGIGSYVQIRCEFLPDGGADETLWPQ